MWAVKREMRRFAFNLFSLFLRAKYQKGKETFLNFASSILCAFVRNKRKRRRFAFYRDRIDANDPPVKSCM